LIPPLVTQAIALAQQGDQWRSQPRGPSASLPDVGRFLAVLAAGCTGGRIGELGTGTGIGAAWMISAMPAGCRLVTVELDERRAQAARELFAHDPRVEVITGDAVGILPGRGPFDLLFADCQVAATDLVSWLTIGGRVVKDDVTPQKVLPEDSPFLTDDPKRRFFFGDPRLVSAEVVLPDLGNSLLVGTRIA
jgi:predicted O-methyltransferase YrrM